MKLAYVAQDRVDIAEAMKCLTRHMKEPRSGHMQELRRLGRFLVKNRRCVLTYARHVGSEARQVIVRRGKHLLRHTSCLQTLVASSSGEAGCYALIRGACTSLGTQSHYQDWMINVPIACLRWQLSSKKCCKRTRNRRTSFADTTLMVAESSGALSLEVGCWCR